MQLNTLYTLKNDEKMHKYLRENSEWYKLLNRNPSYYEMFKNAMKKKYRLGITDRISDAIDNIDLISSVIEAVKWWKSNQNPQKANRSLFLFDIYQST